MSTEKVETGIQDLLSEDRIELRKPCTEPRKGWGRPRKVVKLTVKPKVVRTTGAKKKVSPGEGRKGRKVNVLTPRDPTYVPTKAGLKGEPEEGVRRSSRLRERAAVT